MRKLRVILMVASIFCVCFIGSLVFSAQAARLPLTGANISQARELLRIEGSPTDIHTYDYSPDGSELAVSTVGGLKLFSTVMPTEPRLIGTSPVGNVRFSADGTRLFTTDGNGLLQIWDAASGALVQTGLDDTNTTGFLFSQDRSLLLTLDGSDMQLRDAGSLEVKQSIEGGGPSIYPYAFTPDNSYILGIGYNSDYTQSTIYIWDTQSGQILHRIEGLRYTYSLQISPNGQYVAASHFIDPTYYIGLWSIADGAQIADLKPDGTSTDTYTSFVFDQLNHLLTARSNLVSWDTQGTQLQASSEVSSSPFVALSFSADRKLLLGGSLDHSLVAVDPATDTVLSDLLEGEGTPSNIQFSPDSTTFLTYRTLSADQSATSQAVSSLRLWGIPQSQELLRVYEANSTPETQVAAGSSTGDQFGGNVFFTSYSQDVGVDIYKMDMRGSAPIRLTTNPDQDMSGAVSPDGTKIAYIAVKGDQDELVVMDTNGENSQVLLPGDVSQLFNHPVWSPDGTKIAGTGIEDDHPVVMIVNADGTDLRNLTPGKFATLPRFSPDGTMLVFRANTQMAGQDVPQSLAVINIDGSGYREISRELYRNGSTFSLNDYSWSPDGSQIAYASNHTGAPEINVVNVDGSGDHRITNWVRAAGSFNPMWSPDGQYILFSTGELTAGYDTGSLFAADFAFGARTEVNVMRPDGSDIQQLTFATSEPIAWSPDAQHILYLSYDDSSFMRLRSINRDGSNDQLIVDSSKVELGVFEDVFWVLNGNAGIPAQVIPFVQAAPPAMPALQGPSVDLNAI